MKPKNLKRVTNIGTELKVLRSILNDSTRISGFDGLSCSQDDHPAVVDTVKLSKTILKANIYERVVKLENELKKL